MTRIRCQQGDSPLREQHVSWLAAAADGEDGPHGWRRRRQRQLEDWPFNATGTMDGVGGTG